MDKLALLIFPAMIWVFYRLTLPNQRWEFDFPRTPFQPMLETYLTLARFMVAVDLVAAVVGRHSDVPRDAVAAALAGAFYAFAFIVWITTRYERYVHVRYLPGGEPSPYTTSQYALTRALAWSACAFTVVGVGMVVWL